VFRDQKLEMSKVQIIAATLELDSEQELTNE